jgi:hypothetical protein
MKAKIDFPENIFHGLVILSSIIAGLIMIIGVTDCYAQGNTGRDTAIIDVFKNPDMDSKNMFRWWFPSSDVEESLIKEQVQALYDAGFGGVEVAIVPQFTEYDPAIYGWGTKKYNEMLKYILRAAKALPEKFRVDITITAHWPPSLNTIDPNDPAASKELSYAYKKAVPGKGIELPMPEKKLNDISERLKADFIFTDNFVSASAAKVASVDGNRITLEYNSMKDLSVLATKIIDPATGQPKYTAAGIPENSTLFGKKEKMNDRQYYYQVDLAEDIFGKGYKPAAGSELKTGDWVLFGFYTRGTGQVLSGTEGVMVDLTKFNLPMADRMYATDYYAEEGAKSIIDYWNKNMLTDPELFELLKAAGCDFFEDSIENFSTGPFWTNNLLENFKRLRNYDLAAYLPFIASAKGSKVTFISSAGNQGRIQQDLSITMNDLYLNNRIKVLQKWSHTFNFGYRAQAYGGEGDASDAALLLDVAEQESNDSFYSITGGVNMAGKKFVSMETLTGMGMTYSMPWKYAADQISGSWAAGVNRLIFHGTAYEKEPSHKYDSWPGWHAFQNLFGEPWTPRQIHWNDVPILAGFIARNQAVLQNGRPQVDLAFYKEENADVQHLPVLLNNGYTYEVVTKLALKEKSAVVKNKRLAPDGPAYKAILLNNQKAISMEGADKLIELAKSGLPVAIYGNLPDQVNGVSGEDVKAIAGSKATDAAMQEKIKDLLKLSNVKYIKNEPELIVALGKLGVMPSAEYKQDGIRSVHRLDQDGSRFYYLFNVNEEPVDFAVSLTGEGVPYLLNTWTGDISPLVLYSSEGRGLETRLKLGGRESVIIAITHNTAAFGTSPGYHITESDMDVVEENGMILGIAEKAGTYRYTVAGGKSRGISVPIAGAKRSLDTWNLEIESWGPGDNRDRPTLSKKTMIPVGMTELVTWDKLSVPRDQLAKAGVESMAQVSGIGYYNTRFELADGWTGGHGAMLAFNHGDDMITSIEVNGRTLPSINQSEDKIDIGGYLTKGANTIKIKVVSTMINRVHAENALFKEGSPLGNGPPPGISVEVSVDRPDGETGSQPRGAVSVFGASGIGGSKQWSGKEVVYGLTHVEIIPYGKVELKQ